MISLVVVVTYWQEWFYKCMTSAPAGKTGIIDYTNQEDMKYAVNNLSVAPSVHPYIIGIASIFLSFWI